MSPSAERRCVLVVDDSKDILEMVRLYLERMGFEVVVTESPFGVSRLVRRHRPAVVVLDVMMPALSGDALAKVLEAIPSGPSPSIVFYSAVDTAAAERIRAGSPDATFVPKTDGLRALHRAIVERIARQTKEED